MRRAFWKYRMRDCVSTRENTAGEIIETAFPATGNSDESSPLLSSQNTSPNASSVRTKVPEVEIHLFRRARGPIAVFKSMLGGWEQDQLEVREILDTFGFKSVYAFNSVSGRGAPIRFNPRNGRSMLPYTDGAVISVDGEPKDSIISPITKILLGVAAMTFMIVILVKESPQWTQKINLSGGTNPPWIFALVVIVFTRLRKRTKSLFTKHGC